MSGFGAEPWGAGPWGGGSGISLAPSATFTLTGALAIRENVVRLFFSQAVAMSGLLDLLDGTLKTHYQVTPVDGTFSATGEPARAVFALFAAVGDLDSRVDVTVDRPFTGFPALYTVGASGMFTAAGDPQTTTMSAQFLGVQMGQPVQTADLVSPGRDFANPQTQSALLDPLPNTTDPTQLGTYRPDDTGDVATDEGIANLKKRILRRLFTRKGTYGHLPNYGTLAIASVKLLARPSMVQQIAADAEDQISQEPGVKSCSVVIVPAAGGVVLYQVRVRTQFGKEFTLASPVRIG